MKNKLLLLAFLFLINFSSQAQKVNVYAKNSYVEENLDLNAVAEIFEESKDLADFEIKLNYPQDRISNIDLNDDGKVDYLKVSDKIENNIQIIKIQSETSPNIFEDVASINVILNNKIKNKAQFVNKNRRTNENINTNIHYNDSGIRARDIIIPFIYTALDVFLILRRN